MKEHQMEAVVNEPREGDAVVNRANGRRGTIVLVSYVDLVVSWEEGSAQDTMTLDQFEIAFDRVDDAWYC